MLQVELLKQVLLVKDSLKALNCGAYFLVKDPNNFLKSGSARGADKHWAKGFGAEVEADATGAGSG